MNFDCRIEGNEYIIEFEDGDDTYEGRGSSYEEAADKIEAQMKAEEDED